jgi:arylsulfatase A-like enzyme
LLLTNLFAYAGAASRLDPMADTAAASAPLEPGPALADSLILISIDSLRADRVGSYGNPRETSPAIDRLAREGVRFSNAMSTTSWTTPAHMSMLTGLDVLAHGVITERDRLPDTIPTLAAVLQEAGLATAGIVSAPQVAGHYGFSRGFDLYDDQTIPAPSAFDALEDEPAPVVESLATSWLRANGGKRFFLFLHFWDVHYDYMPPPPYDTMFDPEYRGSVTGVDFFQNKAINKNMDPRDLEHILALYDGELRWVDDHIARILAVLEEMGVEDRTAVIVTSDHGDEFFEHGFKGHGRTLYGEVTRVPLVVRVPGGNGTVVDAPASLTDLMPTALRILGVEAPARMNGVDLLGTGGGLRDRAAVYAWLCSLKQQTNCQAMQHGGEGTLIHRFQPTRVEFYGPEDVLQQRDQARTGGWPRESQLTALERSLNARWQSFRRTGGERGSVELDQATLDRLRDLGYVD